MAVTISLIILEVTLVVTGNILTEFQAQGQLKDCPGHWNTGGG